MKVVAMLVAVFSLVQCIDHISWRVLGTLLFRLFALATFPSIQHLLQLVLLEAKLKKQLKVYRSRKMKLLPLIFSLSLYAACERSSREKRYILVYPYGGTLKMVIGVGVPIQIGTRQSLTYSTNFQFQYPVAQNITQFETDYPPTLSRSSRTKRGITWEEDRSLIYEGLEKVLQRHGVDGEDCLSKAICENARESFYHEDNGLYGHILHILLTPDYGDGELDKNLNEKYADAMYAGRYGLNCAKIYLNCSYDILQIISVLKTF